MKAKRKIHINWSGLMDSDVVIYSLYAVALILGNILGAITVFLIKFAFENFGEWCAILSGLLVIAISGCAFGMQMEAMRRDS